MRLTPLPDIVCSPRFSLLATWFFKALTLRLHCFYLLLFGPHQTRLVGIAVNRYFIVKYNVGTEFLVPRLVHL